MFWFDRHRRFRGQLSAYIDGALDPPAAARLEAHLAQCAPCRTELEQLRATVAALRELPEAEAPRSFALSPERAAVRRPAVPAAPLAFGARIAAAGVAVALAAVVVVDLGDLGGDGAMEEVSTPQMMADREADEGEKEAEGAAPAAVPEPYGTPAAPEAGGLEEALVPEPGVAETPAADEAADFMDDRAAVETPVAGPEEAEAPVAAPSDGGVDALTAAEIGLAAALAVLVAGSLALAFAGRKR
jgi:anti-sigma factor RsiW